MTGARESYRLATYNIVSYISVRNIMEKRYVMANYIYLAICNIFCIKRTLHKIF